MYTSGYFLYNLFVAVLKKQINQLHFTFVVEKEKEEEKEKETNLQDEIKVRSQIHLPAYNLRIFITIIFKSFLVFYSFC